MPAGETGTALDAILRQALSLAHNMAASIPQVRPDISDQAGFSFREIGKEEMSVIPSSKQDGSIV